MPKYHPKIMDAARELKWNPHDQWNVEKIAEVINRHVIQLIAKEKIAILREKANRLRKIGSMGEVEDRLYNGFVFATKLDEMANEEEDKATGEYDASA